jgi:cell division protein FtsB|tara:strand:- start:227 stop:442 length:216 start_codon:yes stop_codon:yes gene_type:complete
MDLKDKIVGLALAALIALVGWNLKETWNMKEQVFKLQQGQEVLSKQIKKNTNFVKKNIKKLNKKKKKKNNE